MPEWLGQTFVGGLINAIYGGINNTMAENREHTARIENYELGEKAAENADARTRALYNDLQSPQALLNQYREAGLSPSLMFGGSGAGGGAQPSAGALGTGAAGISPTTYGLSALESAQIGLIQAQTKKTEAETKNVDTDTAVKGEQVKLLIEETNNANLKGIFQNYQNILAEMQTALYGEYEEEKIKANLAKIGEETKLLTQELRSATANAEIAEKTINTTIQYMLQRNYNLIADTALKWGQKRLTEAQVNLTNQQIQNLLYDITYKSECLEIENNKIKFNYDQLEAQVKQWGVQNGLAKRAQNIAIAKFIGDFINSNNHAFLESLTDLIGLAKGRGVKVAGL